jgi:hypothetical protein
LNAYWNLVPSQNGLSFAPSAEPCERFAAILLVAAARY